MAYKIKRYGWRPDLPSHSYRRYAAPRFATLPASVDLRSVCPAVYDQGDLGSCTANAVGGLSQFLMIKHNYPNFTPSRLFIYYNERVLEGTVDSDAGASIADSLDVVGSNGCPHESLWYYNTVKFTVRPNKSVFADGLKHLVIGSSRLDNTNVTELKSCLASGFAFVFGFTVYDSFESQTVANTGVVPMPQPSENVLGGHAVMAVGYDDASQRFIVRNSWGSGWGQAGYFTMPYEYMTNLDLSSDYWTASDIKH